MAWTPAQQSARWAFLDLATRAGKLPPQARYAQPDQWGGGDVDWGAALADLQAAIDSGNQAAVDAVISTYDASPAPAPDNAPPPPADSGVTFTGVDPHPVVYDAGGVPGYDPLPGGGYVYNGPDVVQPTPVPLPTPVPPPVPVPVLHAPVPVTSAVPVPVPMASVPAAPGGHAMLSDAAIRLYNALDAAHAWPYGPGGGPLQDELVSAGVLVMGNGGYVESGLTPSAYNARVAAQPPVTQPPATTPPVTTPPVTNTITSPVGTLPNDVTNGTVSSGGSLMPLVLGAIGALGVGLLLRSSSHHEAA